MGCFYSFMILVLRLARIIFFRQVVVSGIECIPPDGEAVIFAGNHPNALVDAAMMLMFAGRPVKTMAKSTIFAGPLSSFFRGLGAIPVYRQMDESEKQKKEAAAAAAAAIAAAEGGSAPPVVPRRNRNEDAFREVHDVLKSGGAFSIFPEGVSHSESQLLELKTGLARMALNFLVSVKQETGVTPPLTIVPVGLTYTSPDEWRSCAWIKFGQGVTVPSKIIEMYTQSENEIKRQAVRDLTDIVAASIRRYTVTAPDWETVELTVLGSSLYRSSPAGGHANRPWMCWCCTVEDNYRIPLGSQLYLASIFRQGAVMMIDDGVMNLLRLKLIDYNRMLKGLDCTDDDVRIHRDMGFIEVFLSAIFYFLVICILMPLSIPILILNLPALAIAKLVGNIVANKERDTIATYTIITAAVLLPIFYGVYIGVLSWLFAYKITAIMHGTNYLSVGVWIVFFLLMIPILSFITMRMWEEMWFVKDHCVRLGTLLTYSDSVRQAAAVRLICHELVQASLTLLGNRAVFDQALEAFPEVPLMTRQRAYRVILDFAEANEIHSSESLLLRIAEAGDTHGEGSLQAKQAVSDLLNLRSSFFANKLETSSLVEGQSLGEQDALQRSIRARKNSMRVRQLGESDSKPKDESELRLVPSQDTGSALGESGVAASAPVMGDREGSSSNVHRTLSGSGVIQRTNSNKGSFAATKNNDPRRVMLNLDANEVVEGPVSEQSLLANSPGFSVTVGEDPKTLAEKRREDETAARYGVFAAGNARRTTSPHNSSGQPLPQREDSRGNSLTENKNTQKLLDEPTVFAQGNNPDSDLESPATPHQQAYTPAPSVSKK